MRLHIEIPTESRYLRLADVNNASHKMQLLLSYSFMNRLVFSSLAWNWF